ncbi:CMRF35-like molecule 1 isoform X6 [Choloepus didactylus]|uniref:CMRF35-like molecule 1 isoform X6 n=1 Tax=Choloepus didactylus TaxID=27675 RepID=UPI00189D39E2|nr:CMRF35-like molecule 1 isoform X6 [Choloepus didactylus]
MYLLLLLTTLFRLSDCFSILGPKRVSGPERGSVTLQCHYDSGWETYKKWWCRGADWGSCKILIITTGTEEEVKKGHISIRDNHKSHTFTVTMESLSGKDADIYWCGIARAGFDLGDQAEVTVDPAAPEETTGSPTLSSPRSNGSLTPGLEDIEATEESCWDVLRAGAPAPGGRPLLHQPEPAADGSLQGPHPDKELREVLLHPGCRVGSGIHHHGSLPKGGHFLRLPGLGCHEPRPNLRQYGPPPGP